MKKPTMVILGIRAVRKSVVPLELVQENTRHQNLPQQQHMQGSSNVGEACCGY